MAHEPETKSKIGRPPGSLNKVTASVRALAQAHTEGAINVLSDIMYNGETETVRVSAANSLLDRAHGKPAQAVHVGQDEEAGPIQQVIRWAVSETEAIKDPSKRAD
jgi:hypothetical protein